MEDLKKEAREASINATCGAKLRMAETYTLKDWLFCFAYTIGVLILLTVVFNMVWKP